MDYGIWFKFGIQIKNNIKNFLQLFLNQFMGSRNFSFLTGIICILAILGQSQLLHDITDLENAIQLKNLALESNKQEKMQMSRRHLQNIPVTSETGQTLRLISNMNYSMFGLIVYHEFPQTWIRGQTFQIRGRLTSPAATNGTYVSFNIINKAFPRMKYTFVVTVDGGTTEWKINIETKNIIISDYNIALYTGLSGSYNPAIIYRVRPFLFQNNRIAPPAPPTQCALSLVDNKLILTWREDTITPIQKVSFNQNGKTTEYILTNFQSSLQILHKDFQNFTSGKVTVSISSAYSTLNGLSGRFSAYSIPWNYTFIAGPHNFSQCSPQITLTRPIPWTVSVGTTILIEGTASVVIYNGMKIQQPQNVVGTYNLSATNSLTLPSRTFFSRSLTLTKPGVYILEINANTGLALINRPIYVGTGLPLLPDFVDYLPLSYHQSQINALINAQPRTLEALRSSLLSMINQKRASWGRSALTFDLTLTSVAQRHSNDMITRNFFGHVDPNGQGPQDRARKANLGYGIGQNVAKNIDLREGHERLCRSPGHLENIIHPNYTRVGLGISRNSRGYLYITENYAGPQPTAAPQPLAPVKLAETHIQIFVSQIRDWIRVNYPAATQDQVLSGIVNTWLSLNTSDSLFTYTWNVGKYQAAMLSASTLIMPYSGNATRGLVSGTHFRQPDPSFLKFGVGTIQQENGSMRVVVEYAK